MEEWIEAVAGWNDGLGRRDGLGWSGSGQDVTDAIGWDAVGVKLLNDDLFSSHSVRLFHGPNCVVDGCGRLLEFSSDGLLKLATGLL